jgi:glycosyltransferase involved in cell wall biosynthesis
MSDKIISDHYEIDAPPGVETKSNHPVLPPVPHPAPSRLPDLLCFSHLRWDFVYQRPQHLLSRAAQEKRVFFWEEPTWTDNPTPHVVTRQEDTNLWVATPHLPHGSEPWESQKGLLDAFRRENRIQDFVAWYYTPIALRFSQHLKPALTVYDCMDELSAFRGAPPELMQLEKDLFDRADLVFTGGQSLYEAKRTRHPRVHAFPSSIDRAHFAQARCCHDEPADQRDIPGPRFGFFGVIDERFDIELLRELSERRPDWHFILLGPVVKIAPDQLPQGPNLHYLGMKSYKQLPSYVGHWHAALLPFARNESTEFISPTKTPEYLAAGRPVVSTPIRDVVRPYGTAKLVEIAATAQEFEQALERILQREDAEAWQSKVDQFLARTSWDLTWQNMNQLMGEQVSKRPTFAFNQ